MYPAEYRINNLEKVIHVKKTHLKRASALVLAALMAGTALAGCGGNSSSASSSASGSAVSGSEKKGDASKGKVYYLNFKPEQDKAWQELAKEYTKAKGVEVTVKTAAEGTYEQTLTSEMNKDTAPTLFQVNGPVGLAKWGDFCDDLTNSEIVKNLTSDDFALKEDGKVKGVAYVIETYGIIYNKTLLQKYCDSDYATVKKIEDINSFDKLKTVADEIQANKDKLGVDGAFTSAGMDSSSDWRFKTHLANLPIYFEYKDAGVTDAKELKGTYLDNYKKIFDLYITDSTCKPTELASKTGENAETEFKDGKAVFFQNGTWEYDAISKSLKDDEMGMLPIYIGAGDEANQGLCTGTENYWCVNTHASDDDKAATLEFINWCVSMNFTIPFKAAKESKNALVKIDTELTKAGKTPVSWNFTTMPSEEWKDGVGAALTQYAAGTGEWDAVTKAFVDNWKTEKAKAAE